MQVQAITMPGLQVAAMGAVTGTGARMGVIAERSPAPQDTDAGGFWRLLLREIDGEGCAAPVQGQGGGPDGAKQGAGNTNAGPTLDGATGQVEPGVETGAGMSTGPGEVGSGDAGKPRVPREAESPHGDGEAGGDTSPGAWPIADPIVNMAAISGELAAFALPVFTAVQQEVSRPEAEASQVQARGQGAMSETPVMAAGMPGEGGQTMGMGVYADMLASTIMTASTMHAAKQTSEVKPHDAAIRGPGVEIAGNAPATVSTPATAGEAASMVPVSREPEDGPGAAMGESPHAAGGRLTRGAVQQEQGGATGAARAGGHAGGHNDATGADIFDQAAGVAAGAMNARSGQEPGKVDPELVQVIRDVMARSARVIRGQSEATDVTHTHDEQVGTQAPAYAPVPGAAGTSRAGTMEADPRGAGAQVQVQPSTAQVQSPAATAGMQEMPGSSHAGQVAGDRGQAITTVAGQDAGHGTGSIDPTENPAGGSSPAGPVRHIAPGGPGDTPATGLEAPGMRHDGSGTGDAGGPSWSLGASQRPEAYSVQSRHLQGGRGSGETVEAVEGAAAGAVTRAGAGREIERGAVEPGEAPGVPASGVGAAVDAGYRSVYGGESADRRAGQGMDQGSQQQGSSQHQQAMGAVQHAGEVPAPDSVQQPYPGDRAVPEPLRALVDEVVAQVVEKAVLRFREGRTEMTVQLKPDYLGRIHISVIDHAGTLTAGIRAESEAVRALIEAGLPQLKTSLASQGFNIEQFTVFTGPGYGAPQFGFERGDAWQDMGPRGGEGGRAAGAVKKLDEGVIGAAWAPSSRGGTGLIDYAV
ncbi:MAG: flagellar hook-length control protein FliK [Firmicutes bacterium]|nr:flagellar hook-length control protein FliK [Bacillota bacterium]